MLTSEKARKMSSSAAKSAEASQKRKAQNRAAQRAFRERREKYVKELEDKIKLLENQQTSPPNRLEEENRKLKDELRHLKTENAVLKGYEHRDYKSLLQAIKPELRDAAVTALAPVSSESEPFAGPVTGIAYPIMKSKLSPSFFSSTRQVYTPDENLADQGRKRQHMNTQAGPFYDINTRQYYPSTLFNTPTSAPPEAKSVSLENYTPPDELASASTSNSSSPTSASNTNTKQNTIPLTTRPGSSAADAIESLEALDGCFNASALLQTIPDPANDYYGAASASAGDAYTTKPHHYIPANEDLLDTNLFGIDALEGYNDHFSFLPGPERKDSKFLRHEQMSGNTMPNDKHGIFSSVPDTNNQLFLPDDLSSYLSNDQYPDVIDNFAVFPPQGQTISLDEISPTVGLDVDNTADDFSNDRQTATPAEEMNGDVCTPRELESTKCLLVKDSIRRIGGAMFTEPDEIDDLCRELKQKCKASAHTEYLPPENIIQDLIVSHLLYKRNAEKFY